MPGWSQFVGLIEIALTYFHTYLGSWALAIVLFTAVIKLIFWPLTASQIKSTKVMQELQPRLKEIQTRFKDDKEKQTQETMKLYQELGVNPVAGCLPLLIQLPIWIGLYQALIALANKDQLNEFLFNSVNLSCPSPNAVICTEALNGLGWVTNPGFWPYLILPILTVVTQIGMSRFMTAQRPAPAPDSKGQQQEDPTAAVMNQMNLIMPFMFGFFALQYPAGLALYWVTNNVLTFLQYFIINRTSTSTPPLATATPSGGGVVEVEVAPKGTTDGTSRKRKKR